MKMCIEVICAHKYSLAHSECLIKQGNENISLDPSCNSVLT